MRVLHVCSELYPLLKTGGLADVTAALPPALSEIGVDSRVLVPGFPSFMNGVENKKFLLNIPSKFGVENIDLYLAKIPDTNIDIYVIDAPSLYDRDGNPYSDANNNEYADNYLRFALLSWVAAEIAAGLDQEWLPDVVHCHDWHTGLVPAYLKLVVDRGGRSVKSVFTIHNLAYQGLFPVEIFPELGLPNSFLGVDGVEFYGKVSFLKAGLSYADKITTVSPTYAKEIQTPEQGCGLDGLLSYRKNDLSGVLNGVDPKVWNPRKDPLINTQYSLTTVSKLKPRCKTSLQQMTGLKVQSAAPLFGIVSRLTEQKGLHIVVDGMQEILKRGGQVVVLGSGESKLEQQLVDLANQYPKSVAVQIGYDENQAHRIIAGSDVILVPSRFEPCGLTQLYGLAYGTLPLVHNVGGLADTITNCSLENMDDKTATGFVFTSFTVDSYTRAVRRAFALYARRTDWQNVRKDAMRQKNDWSEAANSILNIYNKLL
jgi:starch synthase